MAITKRSENAGHSAGVREDTKPRVKHVERAQTASERGPGVAPEERQRLAECCAFFKAAHYREAAPGEIRKRDIETAQAEIDAVIERCGKG
jgi:hypothetical protein